MRKRHEMISSPEMGRQMHVWCFGQFGLPLLVFPSAAGFAHEWDAHGMIGMLEPLINAGKIKVYCPESNVSQSWTAKNAPLEHRMHQHKLYEAFILNTMVPWIRQDCLTQEIPIAVAGCSLGGFYAANFALKYPHFFNWALCLSGRYQVTTFTGGQSSQDVYFNNPVAFVSHLHGKYLDHVRQHTHIVLVCGRGAFEEGCIEETIELGGILKSKNIPCEVDIWGHDSRHDWDWWRRQAHVHLNRHFG